MSRLIVVGEIAGAYGVKGWVKIKSFTEPSENILDYSPWLVGEGNEAREIEVLQGRPHGAMVVARLEGVDDREHAAKLNRAPIAVPRECFPVLRSGEYYWADLIGLEVITTDGVSLGKVVGMLETGANDVVEVRGDRDRLIPFVQGEFIKDIRLDRCDMVVDWDPEF